MILLAIAASAVFAIVSPPEPASRSTSPRRPAATPVRSTPKSIAAATSANAASARQADEEGCYRHSQAWTSGNMNIRARPSTSSAILGSTPLGERYRVLASRQGDVYCWLDIDLGWIAVTKFVSASEPPASAPVSAHATSPKSLPVAINAAIQQALNTLNSLAVAPENRCSPYDPDDYPYPQSVEADIVRRMGGRIYGPYSGTTFSSTRKTDIEHMVAKSEAHDSGLCAASEPTRKAFARDLLNLTLAAPTLNRHQKSGKDFAEWQPPLNACWFADRVIQVKAKYSLTIDNHEKAALQQTLQSCLSLAMQ